MVYKDGKPEEIIINKIKISQCQWTIWETYQVPSKNTSSKNGTSFPWLSETAFKEQECSQQMTGHIWWVSTTFNSLTALKVIPVTWILLVQPDIAWSSISARMDLVDLWRQPVTAGIARNFSLSPSAEINSLNLLGETTHTKLHMTV